MRSHTVIVFAAALLALLSACSGEPRAVQPRPRDEAAAASPRIFPVHVVRHGWHTGLIVPSRELDGVLPELELRFGTPAFYEIGWGDKGFYQAQDITAGLTLRALFRSPGTVMHVAAVPVSPKDSFPGSEVVSFCVSRTELESMIQFLSTSFSRNREGRLVPLSKGIYGDSQFFDAIGRYSAVNTCNTWTAKGLESAGFDIHPPLKLTPGSVMRYLRAASDGHACPAEGTERKAIIERLREVTRNDGYGFSFLK